jgi:hypothetical protein
VVRLYPQGRPERRGDPRPRGENVRRQLSASLKLHASS